MSAAAAPTQHAPFEGWAILEVLGHRRLGGYVRQEEMFGAAFARIDFFVGEEKEPRTTQFYNGSSIYALTPTTEEIARQLARLSFPQPVARWELPASAAPASETGPAPDGGGEGRLFDPDEIACIHEARTECSEEDCDCGCRRCLDQRIPF